MTDIYIRRMDNPRRRRNVLGRVVIVLITLAVVLGGVFLVRAGCSRDETEPVADEKSGEAPVNVPDPAEEPPASPAPENPERPTGPEPETEPGATLPEGPESPAAPVEMATPPPAQRTPTERTPTEATPTEGTPTVGTPGTGARLLAEATQAQAAGNLLEARTLGLRALEAPSQPEATRRAEALLGEVGIALVMSPHAMPEKVEYTVEPGDSLAKLAKEYGTTVELLQKGNMLRGSMIRVGDRLRVFKGAFSLRVSKSENDLVVYLDDQFFKRYRVGTGQYNRTPVGDFEVEERISQPTWWRPDGKAIPYGHPDNELGTHWISLNIKGYGLHGTWEPETIGRQASAGCVRLVNDDIEELYTLLPIGTPITIVD